MLHLAVVFLLGSLIYSNTMEAPFIYDDEYYIFENHAIADIRCFTDADYTRQLIAEGRLFPNFTSRIVTFLTFAVNYHFSGGDPTGYHLFNLGIHLLNAFLIYGLARLTMQTPLAKHGGGADTPEILALLTALLFVCHPVQTEAVTYVSQRFTSLATLFYLLAMVGYISYRLASVPENAHTTRASAMGLAGRRAGYYLLALASTTLAMKTKEISFTLPAMLALHDYFFFPAASPRRWLLLLPFFLTMSIIPMDVLAENHEDIVALKDAWQAPRFGASWLYLLTQFRVMLTYLRLLLLPVNQNLDYDYPMATGLFQLPILGSLLVLLALFCLAGYLFVRSTHAAERQPFRLRVISFGILWFFLTLSIESTFIPLLDVIFEHRLYLPSVGFCLVVIAVLGLIRAHVGAVGGKILMICVLSLILVWSGATYARNTVWHDQESLLRDIVSKSPEKSRAHYALGGIYSGEGRDAEAIQEFKKAIQLEPGSVDASFKLASIHIKQGDYASALAVLEKAGEYEDARKAPQFYSALGELYLLHARLPEAERALRLAISQNPSPEVPMRDLGEIYLIQKRFTEAITVLSDALKLAPEDSAISLSLGTARNEQGDYAGAVQDFKRAMAIDPKNAQARQQLGRLLFLLKHGE